MLKRNAATTVVVKRKDLAEVLDYLYEDEKRHYHECLLEDTRYKGVDLDYYDAKEVPDHIFHILYKLNKATEK